MRPELRPYWLAERAALWCYVLSRTSDTSRFGEQDILREIETHLYGAHMSVLALRHIDRCLTHLDKLDVQFSGEIACCISDFKTEYNSPNAKIQEARDALEHEENRVSRIDLGKWPPYEGDFPEALPTESAATHIGMFIAWVIHSGLVGKL